MGVLSQLIQQLPNSAAHWGKKIQHWNPAAVWEMSTLDVAYFVKRNTFQG